MLTQSSPRFPSFSTLSLFALLGLVQSAIWVVLTFRHGHQCGWMALLLGLTATLVLRRDELPRGWVRGMWASVLTAISVAWSNWAIIVIQMSVSLGVLPQESATKLSADLAFTLFQLANAPLDWAFMVLAIIGATLAAR